MRIVRNVVRFAAAALAVSAPIASAAAQEVEYRTTGTFTCGMMCMGSGTSAVTFGDLTLSFAGIRGDVDLDIFDGFSFASFGEFLASGGSSTARNLNGTTFTLNIEQIDPTSGSGSIVGRLTGSIAATGSTAMFMASDDVVNIDGITYNFAQREYSLISQSAGGRVTLQGEIRNEGFDGGGGGSVVPEPSTYALLGTGMLGLLGVAARRRKQQG